jgi:hypothetical protein
MIVWKVPIIQVKQSFVDSVIQVKQGLVHKTHLSPLSEYSSKQAQEGIPVLLVGAGTTLPSVSRVPSPSSNPHS